MVAPGEMPTNEDLRLEVALMDKAGTYVPTAREQTFLDTVGAGE